MITIEKLQAVRLIVSHANCPDGIASAMILRDALPEAKVVMIHYGSDQHRDLAAVPGMLFCDMSPPRERVAEFVAAGAIVLDHHRTARSVVEAFGVNGVFADEEKSPGISGAWLAFEHVWARLWRVECLRDSDGSGLLPGPIVHDRVREFARLAGVRDTWQTKNPDWRRACEQAEALRFYPESVWLKYVGHFSSEYAIFSNRIAIGTYLVDKHNERVKQKVGRAYRFTSRRGTRVLMFEGLAYASDAAELVDRDADLVVGFAFDSRGVDQVLNFSTRSHTSFDCSAFCAANGGGGHRQAAGFSVMFMPETAPNPFAMFRALLDTWESS